MDVIFSDSENPEEALSGFFNMLHSQGLSLKALGQALAKLCDVPYFEDRETREKDGTEHHYPTSFSDVRGAVKRISKLAGVYYHFPSMNLVLVNECSAKVGIRSVDLAVFGYLKQHEIKMLFESFRPKT